MTMSGDNPTTRELVFRFIVDYKRRHDGLSPSVGDIASGCALHPSTVKYHLLKLENLGRIRLVGRRAIEVIGGAWDWPADDDAPAP
ncbi:MAG: hypothetical protein Kow00106_16800 [Anaerolineae bacterium]